MKRIMKGPNMIEVYEKKCEMCKSADAQIKHHISYLPQKIIYVCRKCHEKIHKAKNPKFCPSKYHNQIFYSLKGWIRDSKERAIRKLTLEEIKIRRKMSKNHYKGYKN